jgi:hypothetical protein
LAPESLIDCALGPFEQLRMPVRAIVESDSWNPAEDVTLLGLCPSARSADKPWRSGLTLRGLEFVVVLDQLGFALRCVARTTLNTWPSPDYRRLPWVGGGSGHTGRPRRALCFSLACRNRNLGSFRSGGEHCFDFGLERH